MKPFIERLPLGEGESFAARVHTTPHFEVPWHQHEEAELICFLKGEGVCRAGNYIGTFKKGDIFFLGSKLPHQFEKNDSSAIISAAVVHFREDLWGDVFLQLPENRPVREAFRMGKSGLKVETAVAEQLRRSFEAVAARRDGDQLLWLLGCLHAIGKEHTHTILAEGIQADYYNWMDQKRIDTIYSFTLSSFREKIQLSDVAALAGMTVPAFCSYFMKRTRKTYINFLNEVRIGFAARLLLRTDCSVTDACYSSGFNNLAHFNRQFRKMKGITPSHYRRQYAGTKTFPENEADSAVRFWEED